MKSLIKLLIFAPLLSWGQSTFEVAYPVVQERSSQIFHNSLDQFVGIRDGCVAVYDNMGIMVEKHCYDESVVLQDMTEVGDSLYLFTGYHIYDSSMVWYTTSHDFTMLESHSIDINLHTRYASIEKVNDQGFIASISAREGNFSRGLLLFISFEDDVVWSPQYAGGSLTYAFFIDEGLVMTRGFLSEPLQQGVPTGYNNVVALYDMSGTLLKSSILKELMPFNEASKVNDSIYSLHAPHRGELNINSFELKRSNWDDCDFMVDGVCYTAGSSGMGVYFAKVVADSFLNVFYDYPANLAVRRPILLEDESVFLQGSSGSSAYLLKVDLDFEMPCRSNWSETVVNDSILTSFPVEYQLQDHYIDSFMTTAGDSLEFFSATVDQPLVNCASTGLQEWKENTVHVYPNPVRDQLHLDGLSKAPQKILVRSLTGEIIKAIQVESSVETIDVSGLSPGLYLFEFVSDEYHFAKKVLKQ